MTQRSPWRTPLGAALVAALSLLASAAFAANRGVLVNPGDRITTAIDPADDTDDFVFDALAKTQLSVTVAPKKGSDLDPDLQLFGPDGKPLAISGSLKAKKRGMSLKKFPITTTGRHLLRVLSKNGEMGDYQVKTKGKPPKTVKFKDVPLGPGETHDFVVGGATDGVLKAKIKAKAADGFEVLGVLDPQGAPVAGALARFEPKGASTKAKIDLVGGFGDYTVRVGNAPSATLLSATFKVKLPKVKKRRLDLSRDEPILLSVNPPRGSENDVVSLVGIKFSRSLEIQEVPEVFFDDAPAQTVFVSSTELRVTVPQGNGSVDVTVVNPDGQLHTREDAFDFLLPGPTITSIAPVEGPMGGGTVVDVFGERMSNVATVFMGNRAITGPLTVVDDGNLRFTTEPHQAGPADLRVVDDSARSATLLNAFTFLTTFNDVTTSRMPLNANGKLAGGRAMALGDVDGDKAPDLFVGNDISPAAAYLYGYGMSFGYRVYGLRLFLNDKSGDFKTEKQLPVVSNIGDGGQSRAMALGDLDNDGDLDLVVTSGYPFYGGSVYSLYYNYQYYYYYTDLYPSTRVLVNDGSGNFTISSTALPDPTANDGVDILNAHALALGDLDKDGWLDMVLAHRWNAYTSYSFDFYSSSLGQDVNLTLFDTFDYETPATRVLLNNRDGTFRDVSDTALPDVADGDIFAADAVLIGDVDKDGNADIVITSDRAAYDSNYYAYLSGSKTRILKGDGEGSFTNATSTLVPATTAVDEWGGSALALGDLDDDTWPDLVLSTGRYLEELIDPDTYTYRYFPSTRIFRGSSTGFTDATSTALPAVVNYYSAETWKATDIGLGDLDGDLDLDIVLANYLGVRQFNPTSEEYDILTHATRWLKNDGGTFTNATPTEFPHPAATKDSYVADGLVLGDVDGDLDLDILVTGDAFTQDRYLEDRPYATRQLEKR